MKKLDIYLILLQLLIVTFLILSNNNVHGQTSLDLSSSSGDFICNTNNCKVSLCTSGQVLKLPKSCDECPTCVDDPKRIDCKNPGCSLISLIFPSASLNKECKLLEAIFPDNCPACPKIYCPPTSSGSVTLKCIPGEGSCSCRSGCVSYINVQELGPQCGVSCSEDDLLYSTIHKPICKFVDGNCLDLASPTTLPTPTSFPTSDACVNFTTGIIQIGEVSNMDIGEILSNDFNKDSIADLAIENSNTILPYGGETGNINIFLGQTNGSFLSQSKLTFPEHIISFTSNDFNNDSIPDIVAVGITNKLYISIGKEDNSFSIPIQITVNYSNITRVYSSDFNKDSKGDLAIEAFTTNKYKLVILLGNGDGTFNVKNEMELDGDRRSIKFSDLNNDSKIDLAIANNKGIFILLGNGDGTFNNFANYTTGITTGSSSISFGDLNNDLIQDIVSVNLISRSFSILIGNGNGSFKEAKEFFLSSAITPITLGDFNGDSKLDIATNSFLSHQVLIFPGNGDGTFSKNIDFITNAIPDVQDFILSDFNGDKIPDLATRFYSNKVLVLLNSKCLKPVISTSSSSSSGTVLSSSSSSGGNIITSSSGSVNCNTSSDCPPGKCPNGKIYESYSCLNSQCSQLNFLADPCFDLSTSSSSSGLLSTKLSSSFSGIWKGKNLPCKLPSSSSRLLSQSVRCKGSKMITLNLCVKNGKLEGSVFQKGVIKDANVVSQEIISENEVLVNFQNDLGKTISMRLKLSGNKTLSGTSFINNQSFIVRKLNSNNNCIKPSN